VSTRGAEATRIAPADPGLEEKLDAVWAAHIQVVADDLFEEFAAGPRR
jgi:hypothetical protein